MSFLSQFDIFLGLCFNGDDAFLCLNDEINLTFGFIRLMVDSRYLEACLQLIDITFCECPFELRERISARCPPLYVQKEL